MPHGICRFPDAVQQPTNWRSMSPPSTDLPRCATPFAALEGRHIPGIHILRPSWLASLRVVITLAQLLLIHSVSGPQLWGKMLKVLKCLDAFLCTSSYFAIWMLLLLVPPPAVQMSDSLPWSPLEPPRRVEFSTHAYTNPWQKTSTCNNHNRKFAKSWPGKAVCPGCLVLGARLAFCADPRRPRREALSWAWALCCRRHHRYYGLLYLFYFFLSVLLLGVFSFFCF